MERVAFECVKAATVCGNSFSRGNVQRHRTFACLLLKGSTAPPHNPRVSYSTVRRCLLVASNVQWIFVFGLLVRAPCHTAAPPSLSAAATMQPSGGTSPGPNGRVGNRRSRRRSSASAAVLATMQAVQQVDWPKIFRTAFLFLFVAYPGVSLKILRTFKCVEVEGAWYLEADMRLQCFTGEWSGYALYAVLMGVLFTGGMPVTIFVILWRRRHHLRDPETLAAWGFLYESYGVRAYLWEVAELLRKLWLTAIVVLMPTGIPLQVTTAVLISGWAHVAHALWKPWKDGGLSASTYTLQHGSLFVCSFVFLMGLLFKVDGVSFGSSTYEAVAYAMLVACVAVLLLWLVYCGLALRVRMRLRKLGVGTTTNPAPGGKPDRLVKAPSAGVHQHAADWRHRAEAHQRVAHVPTTRAARVARVSVAGRAANRDATGWTDNPLRSKQKRTLE